MPEPELQTLLDDVKTIKSILQYTDAPLPPVWKSLYYVSVPTLLIIAGLKFLVPPLTVLSFVDTLLWLWVPGVLLAATVVAIQIRSELKKTGTRFMAQPRVRAFFYTRFVIAPAILVLGSLLSLNPAYSMDGAMMVLAAIGMTQGAVVMPSTFKVLPFILLVTGFTELALDLRGPWWTLFNTTLCAAELGWAGYLLQTAEAQEARRG